MEYILPEHKNIIFDHCKKIGLRIENFSFHHTYYYFNDFVSEESADSLEYKVNEYIFYFRAGKYGDKEKYFVQMYPGLDKFVNFIGKNKIEEVIKLILDWLERVKLNQFDYFEIYKSISINMPLLSLHSDYDNSYFLKDEIESISSKIDKLESEITKKFKLTEKELDNLKNEIEFLKQQLHSQKRKDFKIIFHHALVTIFTNYASDPNKFNKLLSIIKNLFSIGTNLLGN